MGRPWLWPAGDSSLVSVLTPQVWTDTRCGSPGPAAWEKPHGPALVQFCLMEPGAGTPCQDIGLNLSAESSRPTHSEGGRAAGRGHSGLGHGVRTVADPRTILPYPQLP